VSGRIADAAIEGVRCHKPARGRSYLDTIGLDGNETVQSVSGISTSRGARREKKVHIGLMGIGKRNVKENATYVCSVDILGGYKNQGD
jgi:hypothetical protein